MEVYYEQNVANPNIEQHGKRNIVFDVLRKVLLGIGIVFVGFMLLFSFYYEPIEKVSWFLIRTLLRVLMLVPFVLVYIFLGRYLSKANAEYDYILNGDILRIVCVTRRTKRKLMATVSMSMVESVGRITCEAYDRYAASKTAKKQFAVCNVENEENIVYIYYRFDGDNFLLLIEPDDEMISALRKSLPRIGIIDKSIGMSPSTKKQ